MELTNMLMLIGGLALFLFGMNVMGEALEKKAGSRLKTLLARLTSNKFKGFLLGLGITAVIQSSSATTVMVVGFVNSGVMTLGQAVGVIMGANLGTSVTSWLLSLTSLQSDNVFLSMLKPDNFTPVLALVGVILYMFVKDRKKKDVGLILLGFSVLMFGMEMMSDSVAPLKDNPAFIRLLTVFEQPILGVLAGTVITAIVQSSSASVGILQALTFTGTIANGTAIPIIMGQNIGTCVSAMISSVGANKNAKRAAFIHLYFNVIAASILLLVFYAVKAFLPSEILTRPATSLSIAVIHTVFKLIALAMLMPFTKQLEKLACLTVRDSKEKEKDELLDERLLVTPPVAIQRSKDVEKQMAVEAGETLYAAFDLIRDGYSETIGKNVREGEARGDMYEDKLGTYLVKISGCNLSDHDSLEVSKLLHIIGDLERLSDHAVNIAESMEEMRDKELKFSEKAIKDLETICNAEREIIRLTVSALAEDNMKNAALVEPLEQVVDSLKARVKNRHIERLQKNECTIELGFVLSDLLNNLERVSDHCSNIAGCIIEIAHHSLDMHEYLSHIKKDDASFKEHYEEYLNKYPLVEG